MLNMFVHDYNLFASGAFLKRARVGSPKFMV
jgi:hypothetical protein